MRIHDNESEKANLAQKMRDYFSFSFQVFITLNDRRRGIRRHA
jgi:hypothetical protein